MLLQHIPLCVWESLGKDVGIGCVSEFSPALETPAEHPMSVLTAAKRGKWIVAKYN